MNYPLFSLIFKHQLRRRVAIHEACAVVYGRAEFFQQVAKAPWKAPQNIPLRDVVASMGHPFSNPKAGQVSIWQCEVGKLDPPIIRFQLIDEFKV